MQLLMLSLGLRAALLTLALMAASLVFAEALVVTALILVTIMLITISLVMGARPAEETLGRGVPGELETG